MPLTDLGGVTRTLKNLIEAGLRLQGVPTTDFEISAAPPDETFTGTAVVSAYLYHVIESPETKNLPPTGFGGSPTPISLSPLGLILQYIVTIVTTADSDTLLDGRALLQQKYLGYIARIVHDNPSITKKTQVTVPATPPATLPVTITILDGPLAQTNNIIEIVMRPAPKEETIAFWSSEEKHVPRLSLFLEARVAVLEAPPPTVSPGIVLSIGEFIFPSGAPQLTATRNSVWFLPPTGDPRKIDASPGRVSLFDTPGSADLAALIAPVPTDPASIREGFLANNRLTIDALGLAPGHKVLQLRRGDATITIDLDQPADQRSPDNTNWNLESTSDAVAFSVYRAVTDSSTSPATTALILPGSYTARVVLLDTRVADQPQPRPSNEVPFSVSPQIVSVLPATPVAVATYTLRIVGAYLNSSLDIFLGVGGVALRKIDTGTPATGEFFVPAPPAPGDLSADVNHITFVIRTTDDLGQPIHPSPDRPLPVQLVVNGAIATPAWITTEATGL